jgi:putative transposase
MHTATRRYAGYFNTRYERTGTLWGGRYRPSRITSDRYFLNCHRYIDLNPVRAALAVHPEDYAWSSYRFYAFGEPNGVLRPHIALLAVHDDPLKRQAFYRSLFRTPLEDEDLETIRACTDAGRDMGDPPRRGRPRKINLAPFF